MVFGGCLCSYYSLSGEPGERDTPQTPGAGLSDVPTVLPPEELERLRSGVRLMALQTLRDPDAADEVVQETLTRALEALRLGRLKDIGKLGGFVRGIARHVIADVVRARQRSAAFDALSDVANGPAKPDALSELISAEERRRVLLALTELSTTDRQILNLSYFEGLTPTEIAERLGEPALRIRKRKSRALERLRRAFLAGASGHELGSRTTDK